jgi:transcriptional regulator with XRE-family HTH domain
MERFVRIARYIHAHGAYESMAPIARCLPVHVVPLGRLSVLRAYQVEEMQAVAQRWIMAIEPKSEGIGARLKSLREQHGLTQTEVARRLGFDQSVVSRYEKGTVPPTDFLEGAEALYGLVPGTLQEHAVREELRRRGRPRPDLPGPAVALAEEWAEAVRLMVERYGSPEAAVRALAHVGADPPANHQHDMNDALAENVRVGRKRVDAMMAEPQPNHACKPSKR